LIHGRSSTRSIVGLLALTASKLTKLQETAVPSTLTVKLQFYKQNRRLPLTAWWALLKGFAFAEWVKVPGGVLLGAILLLSKHLIFDASIFHQFVSQHWQDSSIRSLSRDFAHHRVEVWIVCASLSLLLAVPAINLLRKLFRSWTQGVISGLTIVWALPLFYFFGEASAGWSTKIIGSMSVGLLLSILSTTFFVKAASRRANPQVLRPMRPKTQDHRENNTSDLESDSPIETAQQDRLNRSELVDSLAIASIESRAPVIAIEGDYGDGKSSVLNLLQERLEGQAIVVSFKTWLPNSEESLVRDIFNDIWAECKKTYYVPQLRSRLIKYTKTITGSISSLKGLADLLPTTSQRGEIDELGKSLLRIPRRVVVLLDEMDRLQPEELRVLLKVIRGATSLTNLSYICAFNRTAIEKIRPKEGAEALDDYFEKFFPVSYQLPKADADFLATVLASRLEEVFDKLDWFESPKDKETFRKRLADVWDDALSNLLTNIRKITHVINSVSVAARPISREVDAFDLTIVETIRRFSPHVYEQIRRNGPALVGTESTWGSRYQSSEQVKASRQEFLDTLGRDLYTRENSRPAADMLWSIFPEFAVRLAPIAGRSRAHLEKDSNIAEREKRIAHEDFFPIYFGYRVPESLYSELELGKFIQRMNAAKSAPDRSALYAQVLSSMPRNDPRRLSFLHRLLFSVGRLDDSAAETLAIAVSECASQYSYDSMLPSFAEAGKAMLIVFEVAQRFAQSDRAQKVLEAAIAAATDDTLALRLLTFSLAPERNKVLRDFTNVNAELLKKVFAERMRSRYVKNVEAIEDSLAQADRNAFVLWVDASEEDRQAEIGFWRRYIGADTKRLARMCDILLPSGAVWQTDPGPHIDRLFPLEELKKLQDSLPNDQPLEESENRALKRMRLLLAGEFKQGIGFDDLGRL
jgi:KAP-like P-loop domain-containing protein